MEIDMRNTTTTVVIAAGLVLIGGLVAAVQPQRNYRPKRWTHRPEKLMVINPELIDEPIIAAHAIRWREVEDKSGLHRLPSIHDWQMVLEFANVSRYDELRVELLISPTLESAPILMTLPLPSEQGRSLARTRTTFSFELTIKRDEPVWAVLDFRLGGKVKVVAPPEPVENAAKPTNVVKPPHRNRGPRFQDISVTVKDFGSVS